MDKENPLINFLINYPENSTLAWGSADFPISTRHLGFGSFHFLREDDEIKTQPRNPDVAVGWVDVYFAGCGTSKSNWHLSIVPDVKTLTRVSEKSDYRPFEIVRPDLFQQDLITIEDANAAVTQWVQDYFHRDDLNVVFDATISTPTHETLASSMKDLRDRSLEFYQIDDHLHISGETFDFLLSLPPDEASEIVASLKQMGQDMKDK